MSRFSDEEIQSVIAFHGHWCPGLAIGTRTAELALEKVGHANDEEIVCVAETCMCGVDAIQFFTGCTLGKGNLIIKDYGKMAFTFFNRSADHAVRLVYRPVGPGTDREEMDALTDKYRRDALAPEEIRRWHEIREGQARHIMNAPLNELFTTDAPRETPPPRAHMLQSLTCARCGEPTMESLTRRLHEQTLCIPCFEELYGR